MKNARRNKRKKPIKVDPVIMAELLAQPGIKHQFDQMTPEFQRWYKKLLVDEGIYSQYVRERKVKD